MEERERESQMNGRGDEQKVQTNLFHQIASFRDKVRRAKKNRKKERKRNLHLLGFPTAKANHVQGGLQRTVSWETYAQGFKKLFSTRCCTTSSVCCAEAFCMYKMTNASASVAASLPLRGGGGRAATAMPLFFSATFVIALRLRLLFPSIV